MGTSAYEKLREHVKFASAASMYVWDMTVSF